MTVMSGAELRARYPTVTTYRDTAAALKLVGANLDGIAPDDAHASLYPSREAAEAFAASNLEHHGHPSLGIAEVDGGWVGVLDLRPAIAKMRADGRDNCANPDCATQCEHFDGRDARVRGPW
jgi:hypothetical protein